MGLKENLEIIDLIGKTFSKEEIKEINDYVFEVQRDKFPKAVGCGVDTSPLIRKKFKKTRVFGDISDGLFSAYIDFIININKLVREHKDKTLSQIIEIKKKDRIKAFKEARERQKKQSKEGLKKMMQMKGLK